MSDQLTKGIDVWWCEEHRITSWRYESCFVAGTLAMIDEDASRVNVMAPCRMVHALVTKP